MTRLKELVNLKRDTMKKVSILALVFLTLATTLYSKSNKKDKGVLINGVVWATRNVDEPGKFAENPEDAGMLYQFNSRVGWSQTDPMVSSSAGVAWNDKPTPHIGWDKANDPCPKGWRVPTKEEFEKLGDKKLVSNRLTKQHDVDGNLFTDMSSGQSVFLPVTKHRGPDRGTLGSVGFTAGTYWSATTFSGHHVYMDEPNTYGYYIFTSWVDNIVVSVREQSFSAGYSVRCVKSK
jgi:uncharacterized protein (TIGR02145 family)